MSSFQRHSLSQFPRARVTSPRPPLSLFVVLHEPASRRVSLSFSPRVQTSPGLPLSSLPFLCLHHWCGSGCGVCCCCCKRLSIPPSPRLNSLALKTHRPWQRHTGLRHVSSSKTSVGSDRLLIMKLYCCRWSSGADASVPRQRGGREPTVVVGPNGCADGLTQLERCASVI